MSHISKVLTILENKKVIDKTDNYEVYEEDDKIIIQGVNDNKPHLGKEAYSAFTEYKNKLLKSNTDLKYENYRGGNYYIYNPKEGNIHTGPWYGAWNNSNQKGWVLNV